MPVDVVFLEPCFPRNQREFARALHAVGARVIGIGERPKEYLDDEMRSWLTHYEQVSNVTSVAQVEKAVRFIQSKVRVDRLEASVEAHVMCAAKVREACGIQGTSVETTFLCRDKPAMKEALRKAGVPCAQSIGSDDASEIQAFAERIGFPLIVKPRDAAGAAATYRCDNQAALAHALRESGVGQGRSVAVEEFIEGHEGFFDTITIGGQVVHEFVCHYYPSVLEAMRSRAINPQFICTNRVDAAHAYDEVKQLGRNVITALGIDTSATHMEWFYGPKGLKFSEIGCRPPGDRLAHAQGHAVAPVLGRHRRAAARSRRPHRRLRGRQRGRACVRTVDHRCPLPCPRHAHAAGRGRVHGQRLATHEAPRLRRAASHARRGR
jgi:carbamoylphosphate synthase large subunit